LARMSDMSRYTAPWWKHRTAGGTGWWLGCWSDLGHGLGKARPRARRFQTALEISRAKGRGAGKQGEEGGHKGRREGARVRTGLLGFAGGGRVAAAGQLVGCRRAQRRINRQALHLAAGLGEDGLYVPGQGW
jgi:hypothetical protein